MINNKIVSNDSTVIKIVENNAVMIRYVYALLKFADTAIEENANEEGEIIIPRKGVESISLKLEFCPEKNSVLKAGQGENYFEFKMKPSIMEVFFENFQLSIDKKSLLGEHPLLDDKEYSYEKYLQDFTQFGYSLRRRRNYRDVCLNLSGLAILLF